MNLYLLTLLIFTSHFLQGNENLFDGYFRYPDGDRRSEIFAPFLPRDPNIYIIGKDDNLFISYKNKWPLSSILQEEVPHQKNQPTPVDLLLIDFPNKELEIINSIPAILKQASVIYTTTYLGPDKNYEFRILKYTIESKGFVLFSHWYAKNATGHALFIKREFFEQWKKAASLDDHEKIIPTPSAPLHNLEKYLKPAADKTPDACMEEIDYIYMINLDIRPEKFALSENNLAPYGIKPYRFSAVNGWTLPISTINDLGVRLTAKPKQIFTGTVFESFDFQEYRRYLPLDNSRTFYTWGMTRGCIGCILSHLSVLQDALASNYRTIWVMEDDVEVLSDPYQLPTLIQKLDKIDPQWDILFTDRDTKNKQGENVPCRSLAYRPNFPIDNLSVYLNRFKKIDKDFTRIGMRFGAYSMILRKSAIEKILRFYKTYAFYLPYDMDYWLIPNLRMYGLNYDLVSTQPDAITDNASTTNEQD